MTRFRRRLRDRARGDHPCCRVSFFALCAAAGLASLPAYGLVGKPDETYAITTYTGTASGAGTDSNITLTIEGVDEEGSPFSNRQVLNPLISGDAFEGGQTDRFVLTDHEMARCL